MRLPGPGRRRRSLGAAWGAVAAVPVFFFVALTAGYVVYDVLGYAAEDDDAPLWADVSAALVSLAVVLVPCLAAVLLGRRTARAGDRRGLVPLGLGAVAGLAVTVLTAVTTVADAVR